MANIFEFLSKDGNITPEKARKSRQMQFHDKTVYVWGLRYRWDPSLSMNPVRQFAHFMPPCCMVLHGIAWCCSRFQSSCKPYVDIGGPLRRAKYVWILQRLFLRGFFNENFFSIAVLEKNFTFIPSTSDKNPLTELKDLVCVPLFHGIECFWEWGRGFGKH